MRDYSNRLRGDYINSNLTINYISNFNYEMLEFSLQKNDEEKSKYPDRDTLTLKYDFFFLLRKKALFSSLSLPLAELIH